MNRSLPTLSRAVLLCSCVVLVGCPMSNNAGQISMTTRKAMATSATILAARDARIGLEDSRRALEESLQRIERPGGGGGGPVGMPAADFEQAALARREATLKSLDLQDIEPLRHYVESNYPQRIAFDSAASTRDSAGVWLVHPTYIRQFQSEEASFLARLDSVARDIVLDLAVRSAPVGAEFALRTLSGTTRRTTTDDVMPNVFRGLYVYTVSRVGYKPISDTLDLVNSRKGEVICQLQAADSRDASTPCQVH